MPIHDLTKAFLKKLQRDGVAAQTLYYDPSIRGLGLIARPSGNHSWFVEYRLGTGGRAAPKKRMHLGSTAEVTPDTAARAAENKRHEARQGRDPMAEKQAARKAETVAELVKAFMEHHVAEKRKGTTARTYEQALRTWVVAHLGARKAISITRADVARLHAAIAGGKGGARDKNGRVPPGGRAVANRVVMIVGSMFSWAAKTGLMPEGHNNPARAVEKFSERSRERFLDGEELARLGDALTLGTTDGLPWSVDRTKKNAKHMRKDAEDQRVKISLHVAAVIRLLIFTGARKNEIAKLRWDEVDLKQGLLKLSESKTGKKTIILNPPAIAILNELPQVGTYVFPSRTDPLDKPMDNFDKAWRALIRHAKLPGLRVHDLRHTHASAGVSAGMSLPMVGKLLGHRSTATTARYAHLHVDPVREASKRIGEELMRAMGMAPQDSDNVVPLQKAGR